MSENEQIRKYGELMACNKCNDVIHNKRIRYENAVVK